MGRTRIKSFIHVLEDIEKRTQNWKEIENKGFKKEQVGKFSYISP
jgi:hypothetical protein